MIHILSQTMLLFALANQTRVLETPEVQITIKRQERLEAEPVSKPYEMVLEIKCKNQKKKQQKINIPVCDFDLQDKQTTIDQNKALIAHYAWDAAKSVNNPEGRNYCDSKSKLFHELKITDLCK
jgi:hypothetical protein